MVCKHLSTNSTLYELSENPRAWTILVKEIPDLDSIPEDMWHLSIRQIMGLYGEISVGQLAALDAAFVSLNKS